MSFFRKQWIIPVGVGVASLGVGFFAGALTMCMVNKKRASKLEESQEEKQLALEFEREEAEKKFNGQIQQMNMVVEKMKDEGRTLYERYAESHEAEIQASYEKHPSRIPTQGWEEINDVVSAPLGPVDREIDPNWNYDTEVAARTPDKPYILHRDEYESNEMDFSQTTIMYYKGDNVLCDEEDIPIPNFEKIVGKLRFGHGSLDPSIVYVRNEHIHHEWEIIMDHGYFLEEVLGEKIERELAEKDLRHSVPKFRME